MRPRSKWCVAGTSRPQARAVSQYACLIAQTRGARSDLELDQVMAVIQCRDCAADRPLLRAKTHQRLWVARRVASLQSNSRCRRISVSLPASAVLTSRARPSRVVSNGLGSTAAAGSNVSAPSDRAPRNARRSNRGRVDEPMPTLRKNRSISSRPQPSGSESATSPRRRCRWIGKSPYACERTGSRIGDSSSPARRASFEYSNRISVAVVSELLDWPALAPPAVANDQLLHG